MNKDKALVLILFLVKHKGYKRVKKKLKEMNQERYKRTSFNLSIVDSKYRSRCKKMKSFWKLNENLEIAEFNIDLFLKLIREVG